MEEEKLKDEVAKEHKITVRSEIIYFLAIIFLSFAVAVLTEADLGISMIVAPAYLLSAKTQVLSFGQAEYVIQAVIFIIFCLVMRKFKLVYLSSFLTCLIYGAVLDLWRLIPAFNPAVTPPESIELWLRIVMFVCGAVITSFSVALFFKTYFYPQVYDFFVKGVSAKFKINRALFKTIFDLSCLALALIFTFAFFGGIRGIGWGTAIMALFNGSLIGLFGKLIDRFFVVKPFFPEFAKRFDLEN